MRPLNIPKNELYELYVNRKLSLRDIGKIFSCSPWTVREYLKKYNIPIRNSARGRIITSLNYNKKVFTEKLNPYWIVGFVDGEGSFCFRYEKARHKLYPMFSIAQNNKEILERIATCFSIPFSLRKNANTWHLFTKSVKNCFLLTFFFDQYQSIVKRDQYLIWKYIINLLIERNIDNNAKEHIWIIYKEHRDFKSFKDECDVLIKKEGGFAYV